MDDCMKKYVVYALLFAALGILSGCTDDKAKHFEKKVFAIEKPAEFFQWRLGDPNKAKLVFVYYTALNCPDCIKFHLKIYPKLKEMKEFKDGTCAVVVRDYPYNPISLKITALAYAVPRLTQVLRTKFFSILEAHENDRDDEDKIIGLVKESALSEATTPEERSAIENAISDKTLNQKIFDCRVCDKSALKIDAVPTAFVVKRNQSGIQSVEEIKTPSELAVILDIIKENR